MEPEARLTATSSGPTLAAVEPTNPFIGPRSFERGMTLFGRDREAQEIVDLLIAERIILLYSPSGAGKTSLVQAKLMPMFEEEGFIVRPVIRVGEAPTTDAIKGESVNRHLLSTLRSLDRDRTGSSQRLTAEVAALTLDEYLRVSGPQLARGDAELLIFDQFEEILTVDPNAIAAKEEFFDQVGIALRDKTRWALFSMREDFVPALDPYLQRIPRRLTTRFRLDLLTVAAARKAILGPAEATGVAIDSQVVTNLVDDLRKVRIQQVDGSIVQQLGPFIEPVQLQVVCHRSWRDMIRSDRTEESPASSAVGGVDDALADYYAEQVVTAALDSGVPERTVREWCESQLITPHGVRNQILREVPTSQGLDNRAILALIDAHLVRAEERRGATWYELAHDRLIEPVRASNAAWRARSLGYVQIRADQWVKAGSLANLLPSGDEAKQALAWGRDQPPGSLSSVEAKYLDAIAAQASIERSKREHAILAWGCLVLVVVIAFLVVTLKKEQTIRKAMEQVTEINKKLLTAQEETALAVDRTKDAEREKAQENDLRHGAYRELADKADRIVADSQDAELSPLEFSRRFGDDSGSVIFKYAVGTGWHASPVDLTYDGAKVVMPKPPNLTQFNTVDIYENVDKNHSPLVWSDRVANTSFRSTYQKAELAGSALGTSIIGTASFRRSGEPIDFFPQVHRVELTKLGSDPLRSATSASFGSLADLTSVRTFAKPVVGRTTTQLAIDLTTRQPLRLDTREAQSDVFRLMTLSSMYSDDEHFDASLLRFEDQNHQVRELALRDLIPRGRHLFLDEGGQGRAVKLGRWFELVKQSGSDWFPDGPSIRVEVQEVRGAVRQLGLQGWLAESKVPSVDSLRVWVEWLDAPEVVPEGTHLGLGVVATATPPEELDSMKHVDSSEPLSQTEKFPGGTLVLREAPVGDDPVAPVLLDGVVVGGPSAPGRHPVRSVEIYDQRPDVPELPLTWTVDLSKTRVRPAYQKANRLPNTFDGELGTAIEGAPLIHLADGSTSRPRVAQVDLARVGGTDRVRGRFATRFGAVAEGHSIFQFPDPALAQTTTHLRVAFEARQPISLDPSRRGSDAFRLLTLASMYAGATEFNASELRYFDLDGTKQAVSIADRIQDHQGKRGFFLFEGEDQQPQAVATDGRFHLVKGPGSTYAPSSPTLGVAPVGPGRFPGRLGIQGWLDGSTRTDAPSLVVWLEWLDAPEVIPANTKLAVDFRVTASPANSSP